MSPLETCIQHAHKALNSLAHAAGVEVVPTVNPDLTKATRSLAYDVALPNGTLFGFDVILMGEDGPSIRYTRNGWGEPLGRWQCFMGEEVERLEAN